MSGTGIAYLVHRIGPYHDARIAALGEICDVRAVELAGHTRVYRWDRVASARRYTTDVLFPDANVQDIASRSIARALSATLDGIDPAAVAIPGWVDAYSLAGLAWCLRRRRRAILLSENFRDTRAGIHRRLARRLLVAGFDTAVVGGRAHAAYLAGLGMPVQQIGLGYDVVDNAYFAEHGKRVRRDAARQRAALKLPARYLLTVGRMVPQKNMIGLLEGFAIYRHGAKPAQAFDLVIAGDGPQRPDIEDTIAKLGLGDAVVLAGFRQYDELPALFALAKAFVLASGFEPWGLVVNEAMASGLPVLCSTAVGAASELVQDGENGYLFEPGDPEAIARAMAQIAATPQTADRMGAASRAIIAGWGPDRFAQSVLRAATAPVSNAAGRSVVRRALSAGLAVVLARRADRRRPERKVRRRPSGGQGEQGPEFAAK